MFILDGGDRVVLDGDLQFLKVFVVAAQGDRFDFVFVFIYESGGAGKPVSRLVHHFQVLWLFRLLRTVNSVFRRLSGLRHVLRCHSPLAFCVLS